MPEKSPSSFNDSTPRTVQVPVQSGEQSINQDPVPPVPPLTTVDNFQLHIGPALDAKEARQVTPATITPKSLNDKFQLSEKTEKFRGNFKANKLLQSLKTAKIDKKIKSHSWNTLEWLTTSALIFVVFFFFLNYDSYSQLFRSKLSILREQVTSSQSTVKPSAPIKAQPLPIVANPEAAKKQVPNLNAEIAPPDNRIIIERINQNVPVLQVSTEKLLKKDWSALEKEIQEALRHGVVHYPGTAYPGDKNNVVMTGHSSYFPWDPGRFKDVFALLHQTSLGDTIIVYHNQKKYLYKITEKKVVTPDQVDVLLQTGEDKLTLITCTPVGTNLKRLIVIAKPIP